MNRLTTFVAAVVLTMLCGTVALAADRYAVASTAWNLTSTWSATSGGASGASVPGAGDNVFIGEGATSRTVTIPTGYSAACASVTMGTNTDNTAGTLNFADATSSLSVSGNLTMNHPNGGATTTIGLGAGTLTVDGNLTLANNPTGTQTNKINSITISTGILTVGGNLVFSGTVREANQIVFSAAGTLNIAGSFTITNSVGILTPSTGTVNFNGASAQSIPIGVSSIIYNNLHFNNAGVKTLSAAISATNVTGNVRVQGGTLSNGGFAIVGGSGDTFEVASGATFRLTAGTGMVTGFSTKTFGATSTVDYAGTAQTVSNESYGRLTLSGSGTKTMPVAAMAVAGNFTMSGTASATAGNALTVNGNFTIGSGTTFSASTYTHNLKGNWSNSGTFNAGNSTFNMNGTSAQTMSGSTFYNLTINNSNGITLLSHQTVNNALTLSSGIVATESYTLTAAGPISGASASSYVSGKLARVYSGTGSKDFPIGKGGNYRPLSVNYTSLDAPSTVTAEQFESPLSGTPPSGITLFNDRQWIVTQTGATTFAYNITLDGTGFSPSTIAKVIKEDGETQVVHDATVLGANYTASGLTSFSGFGLGQLATYTISGTVLDGSSAAISGVTVTASGGFSGSAQTDGNGDYMISAVPHGSTGIVLTPAKTGYTFSPSTRTVNNVTANVTGQNFTGTLNTYTVTFNANTGTGTMSSQSANYNTPTALTLNAFTKTGYSFSGWNTAANGSGTSYADGATYDFTASVTLYAQWTIQQYTVTFNANTGTGTMSSQSANYNTPTALTLNAFTKTGYSFSGWNMAANGSGTSYVDGATYDFTASVTLYAQWTIIQYTITATAGPNGSIAPSGSVLVNHGSNQTFTFTANPGYHVDSLFVNGAFRGSTSSYTLTNVQGDSTIHVTFAINYYTITPSAGPNGTITPDTAVTLPYGSTQAFTFAPDVGYHVDSVFVDGAYISSDTFYTFTGLDDDHTIHVSFAINKYTLTVAVVGTGYGTVTKEPDQTLYDHGTAVKLTATADISSTFSGYSGAVTTTEDTVTVVMDGDKSMTATFAMKTYTIVAMSGANGTIDPSGTVTVNYGSDTTFTFTPDVGYHVDSVYVDDVYVDSTESYTFTNVTGDHTIHVTFAINYYTITPSAGPNGTITPDTAVTLPYGSTQAFTFAPDVGYHVDSVFVDGAYISSDTFYTFTGLDDDHTIHVSFAINKYTLTVAVVGTGYGTVTKEPDQTLYDHGTAVKLTATADISSTFSGYSGDVVTTDDTVTVVMDGNKNVTATFAIKTYTIEATSGDHGSISPSGTVTVNYGSDTTFTFTPDVGYHVDSVYVDDVYVDSTESYTFTNVTGDHTIHVTFAINYYTITPSAGPNGTITPDTAVTLPYGSTQAFTFAPDVGYHVDSVFVDGAYISSDTFYTFTGLDDDHTIHVSFAINKYTLTVAVVGTGYGTVTKEPDQTLYDHGTAVKLTATADISSTFSGYSGAVTTTEDTVTVVMDGDKSMTATFAIKTYTIEATSGDHGSISPSGTLTVNYGSDTTFTFTPDVGYHVDSVYVDDVYVDSTESYTFTNVTVDHTIHVTFAINYYTITPTAGPNGTITPDTAVTLPYGSTQAFTFAPDVGYHVDSVFVDGMYVDSTESYTFTDLNNDHAIYVKFAVNKYTIAASVVGNGTIDPSGAVLVEHGSDTTFTMTANPNHHIDSVLVDGVNVGVAASYPFTDVTSHHTIMAYFSINKYTIMASVVGSGTISPSGAVLVNHGSNQSFAISAVTGHHIDSVLVDGVNVGAAASYPFTDVASHHTIVAYFSINMYALTIQAVNGSVLKNPDLILYPHGSSVLLTAVPDPAYLFTGWSGHASGTLDTVRLTMDGHKDVTAHFTIARTIAVSYGPNGRIEPGTRRIPDGSNQSFNIIPNRGYHIDSVFVNDSHVGSPSSYTFINVLADASIRAKFAINYYPLTVTVIGSGSGSVFKVPDSTHYSYLTNVSLTATPSPGSSFTGWSGSVTSTSNPLVVEVDTNKAIIATFTLNSYTIQATRGPNGTITPSGNVFVQHGANQTFTMSPDPGYHVDSVFVNSVHIGRPPSYTFFNVRGDSAIHVKFAINKYTVISTAGPNGSIAPQDTISVSHGDNIEFTITPIAGYHVDNVLVSGRFVGGVTSFMMSNIRGDSTIHATFAINTYPLNVTNVGTGSGTVARLPDLPLYQHGAMVQLTANPAASSTFTRWEDDTTAISNPLDVPMYKPRNISARFTIRSFTISTTVGSNGSISPIGPIVVTYGSDTTFTFIPISGYHIDSVLVNGRSVGPVNSYRFYNVRGDSTIRATFAINRYALTVNTSGSGTGTVSKNPNLSLYDHGTQVTLTATPNAGSSFTGWSGSISSTQNPVQITMDAAKTITATLTLNLYTVTASVAGNGSINPQGNVQVSHGASQAFTIIPNSGHHIDSVFVNTVYVGRPSSYTFVNVRGDSAIHAKFAINIYTITASAGDSGSISPSGSVPVAHGSNQTFTFTPVTGYQVDSVFVNGTHIGSPPSYTFSNVAAPHTIRVTFGLKSYIITATSGPNGTITPSGSVSVAHGSNRTFNITPNTGYSIADVLVNGGSVGAVASYTFTNLQGNATISATFSINMFTITTSVGPNGTISPTGPLQKPYGSSQTFRITPNIGYAVGGISVNGIYAGRDTSYTIDTIRMNYSIFVTFAPMYYALQVDTVGRGSVSRSPDLTAYTHGVQVTLTATPALGWAFAGWSGSAVSTANPLNLLMNGPKNIVATFVEALRFLTVTPESLTLQMYGGRFVHPVVRGRGYPNWSNLIEEVVGRGGFRPNVSSESDSVGGMRVGISDMKRQENRWIVNSRATHAWARLSTWDSRRQVGTAWNQIQQTLMDQITGRRHAGMPHGLDIRYPGGSATTRVLMLRQFSRISPREHDNRLFGNMVALKMNIAASDLGITTSGFGELELNIPGHTLHGKSIRKISAIADTGLTFWDGRPASYYMMLDSIVAKINAAFVGRIDTVSFTMPRLLKLRGGRTLTSDVPFIRSSGGVPRFIEPSANYTQNLEGMIDEELLDENGLPVAAKLYTNYPNPFNPATTIGFRLREISKVTMRIYNVLGQEIATVLDGLVLEDGLHEMVFEAGSLPSGVYFYRVLSEPLNGDGSTGETFTAVKKMLLVK